MRPTKTEVRLARCAERAATNEKLKAEILKAEMEAGGAVVTRRGLAAVLKCSVRTVDEMVSAGEITPVRPGGKLVRFYLPDVVRELTAAAVARLRTTGLLTTDHRTGIAQETQGTERTKGV